MPLGVVLGITPRVYQDASGELLLCWLRLRNIARLRLAIGKRIIMGLLDGALGGVLGNVLNDVLKNQGSEGGIDIAAIMQWVQQ